uniref:Uncharacterized protein n=1 Tax=Oryza barthii TaxID=65489 RepID=A0A0D3HRL8_9ORYZ
MGTTPQRRRRPRSHSGGDNSTHLAIWGRKDAAPIDFPNFSMRKDHLTLPSVRYHLTASSSRATMGLCFSGSSSSPSPPPPQLEPLPGWSDLPADLAGQIVSSLPFHHDRLSFAAVCSQWRLGALQQRPLLPPALPCLLTSLADDGVACRIPMSNDALWCVSSHDDGWLMHMDVFKPCIMACDNRHFLKNSFSNVTIDIPCRFDRPINAFVVDNRYSTWPERFTLHKIIVCSPDLVVAASRLIDKIIVSFRLGIDTSWSVLPYDDDDGDHKRMYEDIALYRGKLYALTSNGDLLVHEIKDNNTLSRAELVIRGAAAEPPLSHL